MSGHFNAMAVIYFALLLLGIYWPVQSFDKWARIVTHLGPVTYPAESTRAIITKGVYCVQYVW